MATLQDYSDFQNDLMTRYETLFGFTNPLYAELTGARIDPAGIAVHDPAQERITPLSAAGRETFVGGTEIRIPIQVADVPGAAGTGRGGTFAVTSPFDTAKATLKLCELTAPIGVDIALERDAKAGQYTALSYIETLTASAYRGLARIENDMLHGDGDGLLAAITNGDTDGLVATVGTAANFDQLTPGRVVDVRVTADGSDPGQGLRRKIVSVDRSAGTVTFSTTQVASDGGSGNITLSTNGKGIYIDSTYDAASANGKAMQGLGQCVTSSGTAFEGIDVANVGSWGAVTHAGGSSTLSDAMFEDIAYQLSGYGVDAPDFAIAHTKVVDPYKDTKTQYLMIRPETRVVPSGFAGIVVQVANKDFPLLKDIAAPRETCRVITKEAVQLWGDSVGPQFVQDDGGMWRFFTRSTYKEAVILDRVQLGVRHPGKIGVITGVTG